MQFLNPMLLWGLILLIIPIIIHLFYFRRYKEVQFTNVKFLSELKEEKSVRDRLRQLLILLMRLAAIAFLIFAFARPFIPGENQEVQGAKSVSVYIDNSFSMQAYGDDVSNLKKAKRLATTIVNTYENSDEFRIISNQFDFTDQRWLSREDALDEIQEIDLYPIPRTLRDIVNRLNRRETTRNTPNKVSYIISDFQESILSENLEIDTRKAINFIQVQSARQPNLSIDSIWMSAPVFEYNQVNSLYVKVSNYGTADVRDAGLSIQYDSQTKPLGVLEVKAGESKIDTVHIVPQSGGWQHAEIQVKDFPVEFDNTYYIAFNVPRKLRILSIYGENPQPKLNSILAGLHSIHASSTSITQVDYAELPLYDLIIIYGVDDFSGGINQALINYLENGGKVLFFPAMNSASTSYDNFIRAAGGMVYGEHQKQGEKVYSLNTDAYVFTSVFTPTSERMALPKTSESYIMKSGRNYVLPLMKYRNGQVFIAQVQSGGGFLYQAATGLSDKYSNLLLRTDIFIPMIYRMALQRNSKSQLSYIIGEQSIIEIKRPTFRMADEPIKIKGPIEFIPGQDSRGHTYILNLHNQVKVSGVYDVMFRDSLLTKLAFNYNRLESNLAQATSAELSEMFPNVHILSNVGETDVQNFIQATSLGTELWRWSLILVLIFLALEQLFIRLYSYE